MKTTARAVLAAALLSLLTAVPAPAQNVPANSVQCRLGIPTGGGPVQSCGFQAFVNALFATIAAIPNATFTATSGYPITSQPAAGNQLWEQMVNSDYNTTLHVGSGLLFYGQAASGNIASTIDAVTAGSTAAGSLELLPSGGLLDIVGPVRTRALVSGYLTAGSNGALSSWQGYVVDGHTQGINCDGTDETTAIQAAITALSSSTDIGVAKTLALPTGVCAFSNLTLPGIIRIIGAGPHQTKLKALNTGAGTYGIASSTYTSNANFPSPPVYIENISIDCGGFKDNCFVLHGYESRFDNVFIWGATANTGTNLLISSRSLNNTAMVSGMGDIKIFNSYIGYSTATAGYQVRINDPDNRISDGTFSHNLMQQAVIKDFYLQAGGLAGWFITNNHSFLALGTYDWDIGTIGQSFTFSNNYVEGAIKVTVDGPATSTNWLCNNAINGTLDVAFGATALNFTSCSNNFGTAGKINSMGTLATQRVYSKGDMFGVALAYTWTGGAANPSIIIAENSTNSSLGKRLNGVSAGSVTNAAFLDMVYVGDLKLCANSSGIFCYDTGGGSFLFSDTSNLSLDGDIINLRNRAKTLNMLQLTATGALFNSVAPPTLFGTTSGSTVLKASAIAGTTTVTLPAATDTLVGKATTDTLTNKTFDTAGTGNSFSINGVAATANTGTGSVVRASTPTLVTPVLGAATATSINFGGQTLSTYTATTWTPTITTTSTVGTPAYSVQVGSYEQIGRLIVARFNITLSGWTGSPTGNAQIGGLPVTSANVASDVGNCSIGFYSVSALAASNFGITGVIQPNTTVVQLLSNGNAAGAFVTAAQAGTTMSINGACLYHN